jgi:signal transduction histidine kinase
VQGAFEVVTMADATPYRFTLDLPDVPVLVLGDPRRLEQVFVNLLANAAKHTAQDGTIRIMVAPDTEQVTVRVLDTGVGIAPGDIAHIFDLFNRGTSPQGPGLGLGLTLAKALVEQHGGELEAFSDGVGHGAEFRVRLPLTRTPSP